MGKSEYPPPSSESDNFFEGDMNHWNYRIIQDGDRWYVGEVYYGEDGRPEGFTATSGVFDDWSRQEDLITTYKLVGLAMDKPYLRVTASGVLTEVLA